MRTFLSTCGLIATVLSAGCGIQQQYALNSHLRSNFYVGGRYEGDGKGGHIMRGQMYVEKLRPVGGATQTTLVVLIHGNGMTGTNFLDKPDGGRGWATDFVSQGYEVYVLDQVFRGRSAWPPSHGGRGPLLSSFSAEHVQNFFTATHSKRLWPQAAKHTQWPGRGVISDPIFDNFYAATVPFVADPVLVQSSMQKAGVALLDKIQRPAVLVGHSQGGLFPQLIADARPQLAKGLILVEPTGPPFFDTILRNSSARAWGLADIPLTYSTPVRNPTQDLLKVTLPAPSKNYTGCVLQADAPPPRQLPNLATKPVLVVTSESSYHATYDGCTVKYLRQAGCSQTEHVQLEKSGIRGNGHMMFLEENSREIQELLHDWIQRLG